MFNFRLNEGDRRVAELVHGQQLHAAPPLLALLRHRTGYKQIYRHVFRRRTETAYRQQIIRKSPFVSAKSGTMKRMNLLAKAGLPAAGALRSQAATTAMTTMEATMIEKTPADGQFRDQALQDEAPELPSMTVTAVNSTRTTGLIPKHCRDDPPSLEVSGQYSDYGYRQINTLWHGHIHGPADVSETKPLRWHCPKLTNPR